MSLEKIILALRITGFSAIPLALIFLFLGIRLSLLYPPKLLKAIIKANQPPLPQAVPMPAEEVTPGGIQTEKKLRMTIEPVVREETARRVEELLSYPTSPQTDGWFGVRSREEMP